MTDHYFAYSEISDQVIKDHLFTSTCPPLDILVRTSGEIRLSDFLLWQANDRCQIQFVDCYWPEFSLWKFLPILLEYQIYSDHQTQEKVCKKKVKELFRYIKLNVFLFR